MVEGDSKKLDAKPVDHEMTVEERIGLAILVLLLERLSENGVLDPIRNRSLEVVRGYMDRTKPPGPPTNANGGEV